jgi:hypothetical protein
VQKIVQDAGDFDILYLGNLDGNHAEHVNGDVYKVNTNKYLTGMGRRLRSMNTVNQKRIFALCLNANC